MKSIYTLVDDIYQLMMDRNAAEGVDVMAEIDRFADGIRDIMKAEFLPATGGKRRKLRLSGIGKPDRQQWYAYNGYIGEKLQPHTLIKFHYGHILEELVLFYTRMAGHIVEDEQKECEVGKIKGHMDARIDGTLIDVKSASTFAFKKFKEGTLAEDDPFGYVAQLKAYAKSEGDEKYGWLTLDKGNGHLTYLEYNNTMDHPNINYDIEERVEHIKEMVKKPEPPERCYELIPDGKSGNMKLPVGCSYCNYKKHCYPEMRTFLYSTGPRFLAVVENEPNVKEITDDV